MRRGRHRWGHRARRWPVLAGKAGRLGDLKLLSDHRGQLVCARTRLINRIHKDLVVSHPGYENTIPELGSNKNQTAALTLLRGDRSVSANLICGHVRSAVDVEVLGLARTNAVIPQKYPSTESFGDLTHGSPF